MDFDTIFKTLTGHGPLRWQRRLHGVIMAGAVPPALDVPTGLGKTSVMAVWLAAKILGAELPNRLVYVVDRRTVVDQATEEAEKLRNNARNLTAEKLPENMRGLLAKDGLAISTLRGQHLDNRRWMDDPAAPAIIIGTVDMIGSRLLFQGYGVPMGMRPFQAGLLGTDTLLVLDEAHLCPPFQVLLDSIATDKRLQPDIGLVQRFRLMSLSATGNRQSIDAFSLDDRDQEDEFVQDRLNAAKHLSIVEADGKLEDQLARQALDLAEVNSGRIAIFCTSRDVAQKVVEKLDDKKSKRPEGSVVLLAGARRVMERERARTELVVAGFLTANEKEREENLPILPGPTFLVATAAGEVGIDLDADHAVMDLVAAERMIQRLGRINRKGGEGRAAQVRVIDFARPKETDAEAARRQAVCRLLETLPAHPDGTLDASPGKLRQLRFDGDLWEAARTPDPLYPALDRPTLDAWAMTSLRNHPGRPEVAPWLRGWVEEDEPEVTLVWRRWPWDDGFRLPDSKSLADFFEMAPPSLAERLEVPRSLAMEILAARAKALAGPKAAPKAKIEAALEDDSPVLIALDDTLRTLTLGKLKETRDRESFFSRGGAGTVFVVSHALGGLDGQGLLSKDAEAPASCLDHGWDENVLKLVGRRILDPEALPADPWHAADRFALPGRTNPDSERVLTIAVYRGDDRDAPGDPAIRRQEQTLSAHSGEAAVEAGALADRLNLPASYRAMLIAAAASHDLGKARPLWQLAMGAPRGKEPYAKTTGKGANPALLIINGQTYRHEFGSLLDLERHPEHLADVPTDLRELALHLVAAHHGYARPWIAPVDPDLKTAVSSHAPRSADAALRFARLQAQWGPWGLAWWEALLRAADQRVSRRLDKGET